MSRELFAKRNNCRGFPPTELHLRFIGGWGCCMSNALWKCMIAIGTLYNKTTTCKQTARQTLPWAFVSSSLGRRRVFKIQN